MHEYLALRLSGRDPDTHCHVLLLWRKIRGCAALVLDFLMTLLVLTDHPPPLLLRHVHIHEHWTFHAGWE